MSKEMFSKEQYSDAERIRRVWDVIEIKNLMGRRTFYNAQGQRRREIEELWVQAPDRQASASYGTNDGYLTGMASIKKHYMEDFETAQAEKLRRVAAANPEKVLDSPEFFGVGTCVCEPLTTPLVELSADGVYAKGTWFTPGQKTDIDVDSASAKYVYGKIFADFAKENGQWKIFHWFFGEEYAVEAGDPFDYPTELEKEAHPELYPKVQKESTGASSPARLTRSPRPCTSTGPRPRPFRRRRPCPCPTTPSPIRSCTPTWCPFPATKTHRTDASSFLSNPCHLSFSLTSARV